MTRIERLRSTLAYLAALFALSQRSAFTRRGAVLAAAFMFANNLILFTVWLIYFRAFSNLGGWHLDDLAILYGVLAWAFGLTMFVFGGVRDIALVISRGELDLHLGQPRHPLLALLLRRATPSGLGDLLSAFVFWCGFAGLGLYDLPLLLLVATAAGVVIVAATTLIQCLVFWMPRAARFCEDLFQMFLMLAFYPQHGFGFLVRLVLFTAIPAAFVTMLPVEAVRDGDVIKAACVVGAAAFYSGLAVWVFDRGLRRYVSGSQMLELR